MSAGLSVSMSVIVSISQSECQCECNLEVLLHHDSLLGALQSPLRHVSLSFCRVLSQEDRLGTATSECVRVNVNAVIASLG